MSGTLNEVERQVLLEMKCLGQAIEEEHALELIKRHVDRVETAIKKLKKNIYPDWANDIRMTD